MTDMPYSDVAARDAKPASTTTVLVVGVDFSPMTEHLLRTARDLVRVAHNAELHCVNVVPSQPVATGFIEALPPVGMGVTDTIERAHEQLEKVCGPMLAGISNIAFYTHVRVGNPADELPRLANEVAADLIVVEAHGRTGLRRMLHRSVAAQVARNAPCSVLTVREKQPRVFEESRTSLEPHAPRDEGAAVALEY